MTSAPTFFRRNGGRRLAALVLLASAIAAAQINPSEHVFHASRADIDKALASLHATSPGRLPILDGFVGSEVSALEKYQRAYYQYKLEIRPVNAGTMSLRVIAKVTAWYVGDNATQAGYRVLPSNGRLEADLVERLEEALQHKSADVAGEETKPSAGTGRESTDSAVPQKSFQGRAATLGSASAKPSTFGLTFPNDQSASRVGMMPPNSRELAQQKHFQQLSEQAANLEEVLRSQMRPNDLAAVRKTGTLVLAKPIDTGAVLFRADAEDEFKVLEESLGWVHVQVSGISRGWIRRSELEMPGESVAVESADTQLPAKSPAPETHEETSLFPGDWSALRGHLVRITWVRASAGSASGSADRWLLARSVFRDTYGSVTRSNLKVDGVVIVIDAADGGMIAATSDALRRWNTGALSDAAFRKECWTDSPEALGETAQREGGTKPQNQ